MNAAALPVISARWEGGEPIPNGVTGTAFSPAPGLVVTCAHCVPTVDGISYFVVPPDLDPGRIDRGIPLTNLSHDGRGLDLAIANADLDVDIRYGIASRTWAGLHVWCAGYPHPRVGLDVDGKRRIDLEPRMLRGYVTRELEYDGIEGRPAQPSLELDMLAPAGMSGAALVGQADQAILVGVVYGSLQTYDILEEREEVDGQPHVEVRRVVSFALAHSAKSLAALAGEATQGRPLSDFVPVVEVH